MKLPVVWDENGKEMTQSCAIFRHFARKYGLYGDSLDDNLRVDEVFGNSES